MLNITEDNLRHILAATGFTPPSNFDRVVEILNKVLDKYDINNPQRISYALAHFIYETGGFNLMREMGGSAYLLSKKYYPYIGRGIPQLTWRENYLEYTNYRQSELSAYDARLDFVENPANLETLDNAIDVGGWYWSKFAKLNDDADNRQFSATCYKLNGPNCSTVEARRAIMLQVKKEFGWT